MAQFYAKLEELIKHEKIDEFKKLLQNAKPSDLTDSSGMTLLHFAAQKTNLELTKLLLDLQHDINAQDSFGATPILTASHHKNFKVVKILLDKRADIFIADAKDVTLLDNLVQNRMTVPTEVFESFFDRLKNTGTGVENIVSMLTKSKCPLDLVLLMRDPNVMRAMLESQSSISKVNSCTLVSRAMKSPDLDSLEVLLLRGTGVSYRRKIFLQVVCEQLLGEHFDLNSMRIILKYLPKWGFIDRPFISTLQQVFQTGSQEVVRLLLECDVHEFAKKKWRLDLIAGMFVNDKLNASDLLKNREFDANAQNEYGYTPLQLAAKRNAEADVKFLLEVGADPNAKGRGLDETPLQLVSTERCIDLLLFHGADPEVTGQYDGIPMVIGSRRKISSMKCQLALSCVQDPGKVRPAVGPDSEWSLNSLWYVDNCYKQVEWTKTKSIDDSDLTIFDVFSANVECLAGHVRDEDTVTKILDVGRDGGLYYYYLCALKYKLSNALLMHEWKTKLAELLAEAMKLESDHLVIDKVVGYFKFKHLLAFS